MDPLIQLQNFARAINNSGDEDPTDIAEEHLLLFEPDTVVIDSKAEVQKLLPNIQLTNQKTRIMELFGVEPVAEGRSFAIKPY